VTTSCSSQDRIPARLATVSTPYNRGPGGYIECGLEYFSTNVTFVEANPNLKWVPSNTSMLDTIVGPVRVSGSYCSYFIGRINLRSTRGVTYQTVSKLHVDKGMTGLWYITEFGSGTSASSYEVLACNYLG
jgi:hypothetical protein